MATLFNCFVILALISGLPFAKAELADPNRAGQSKLVWKTIKIELGKLTKAHMTAKWATLFTTPATGYFAIQADGTTSLRTGSTAIEAAGGKLIEAFWGTGTNGWKSNAVFMGMCAYANNNAHDTTTGVVDDRCISQADLVGEGLLVGCRLVDGSAMTTANRLALADIIKFAKASAKGDPHVTNMQGEKFDVLKSGDRVMVQYPRESSDPSLVVTAQVVRADAKWCENTFIESVVAQGSMLGSSVSFTMGKLRAPGPFKVTVGGKSMSLSDVMKKKVSLPTPGSYISGEAKQMTLTLAGGVSVQVQLVKHSHFQFFNLDVSGLSNLPGEVGGLLGMDDHSGEAHEDCKFKTHKKQLNEDDDLDDLASLLTAA